ncbi:MAG: hypothetical protein JWO31_102 [Phycisphaerales bacterium]|nr:hypothetical protein [Phycisphaerales bacterium]
MDQANGMRTACVVVLLLASSAFAYTLGRQQGEAQAREELGIEMPAVPAHNGSHLAGSGTAAAEGGGGDSPVAEGTPTNAAGGEASYH